MADDDAAAGVEQSFASADAARFALDILTTPANHSQVGWSIDASPPSGTSLTPSHSSFQQIISESVLTSLISLVSHQVAVLVSYWGKGKALPSGLAKLRPRTVMLLKQLTLLVEQINLTDQHLVLVCRGHVGVVLGGDLLSCGSVKFSAMESCCAHRLGRRRARRRLYGVPGTD